MPHAPDHADEQAGRQRADHDASDQGIAAAVAARRASRWRGFDPAVLWKSGFPHRRGVVLGEAGTALDRKVNR